ncbi:MAG: hypothetical protein FWF78_10945 [Defluviitaleaceae bacterium]|nr:hypothetical protein [Defluviitaleaceae bacterium]
MLEIIYRKTRQGKRLYVDDITQAKTTVSYFELTEAQSMEALQLAEKVYAMFS